MVSLDPSVTVFCEDACWIGETLRGNTAAFGHLVSKYQDRLYRSVVLLSGSQDDALDVVQDAFVQAMLKLDTFQSHSQFYTWLYRIAYNLAITARVCKKRQRQVGAQIAAARRTDRAHGRRHASVAWAPETQLERKETCRQVRQAIARLEEDFRVVLVLREIDGLCYAEIARVLGLPKGTVRSRLHRARLQLLNMLKFSLAASHG
jgi:RNA polymerase sigma-70 factor, ECF subfamily